MRRDRTSWTRLHLPVCFFLFKLILIFLFIFIYLFISTERAAYLKPLIKQAFDAAQNQNYEGLEAHLETYSLFVPFAFVPTNRPWLQPAEERLTLLDTLLQNDDVPIDIVCKVIKYGGKVRMDSIAIACENNRIDIVRALLDNGLVQVDKLGGMFLLPCFYYSQSRLFFFVVVVVQVLSPASRPWSSSSSSSRRAAINRIRKAHVPSSKMRRRPPKWPRTS